MLQAGALAADAALFATTDQNPFIQVHAIPSPGFHPQPGPGRWSWQFTLDMTNNALEETRSSGETVTLDGETYRGTLTLAWHPSRQFSLGLNLPLVSHGPGMFDGLVREWHSLLGLSNQRQNKFAKNELDFTWRGAAGEESGLSERSRGIGDVRLYADWRPRETPPHQRDLVVRAGVKFPTGSAQRLTGSGSTGLSVQALGTDPVSLARWGTSVAWSVGLLHTGTGDLLEPLRNDLVAIGSVGASRPLWRRLSARLQLDAHSAFYDSRLRPLGSASVQLTFGGSLALASGRLDIAMIENLFTDTTPDVGLHIAWREGF